MSNLIDLDPGHEQYLTVQSKQLAMTARMCMHIHWCDNQDGGNCGHHKSKGHHHHLFPCLPFHFRRHSKHRKAARESIPPYEHTFDLIGESLILSEEHVRCLGPGLPTRVLTHPWTLKFCTSRDGFSLHTLYRNLQKVDSPVLLVVEDLERHVFGALASCNPHTSDRFYGTSECYLFSFHPDFHEYKWCGDNFYFMRGTEKELYFGSGDGEAGLWLDSDLNRGRTEICPTFGSPPLIPSKDFIIRNLECWAFELTL